VVHLRCHLLLRNHKDVGSLFSSNLGDGEGVLWQFSGDDEDPTGAVVHVEASGAVGLARAAKNRCGGERG
jgi:hypothetical protein